MLREMTGRSGMAGGWLIAVAACLPLIMTAAARAAVIHVYEGESIQAAIDSASAGDEIIVHPGTYYQSISFGNGITVRSVNPSDPDIVASTVLDGEHECVVVWCGGERDTVLCGLTIANGYGWGWDRPGGLMITGNPTVSKCVFRGNSAGGDLGGVGGGGGAILAMGSNPLIIDCMFTDNSACDGGEAGGWGGAIALIGSDATVVNCVFSGNVASSADYPGTGGAVHNSTGIIDLINCTFWGNVAEDGWDPGKGGAVYNWSGIVDLVNCVLWDDYPDEIYGSVTARYSNVMGGWDGTGNINADPLFADPANGDFHLPSGSPCIDAGDNTGVPDGVGTDLDTRPRFSDDPETHDTGYGDPPIVDMGAFEYLPPYEDPDDDGIPNMDDNCPAHYNPDQVDCDDDGIGDICALAWGLSKDCNGNGVPDDCDIDSGFSEDCNGNGIPDECDLDCGVSEDCNENGIPDECDIDSGYSNDYNQSGIPDECECLADFNNTQDVDIYDLFKLLGKWGTCADPDDCPWDLCGPAGGPPDGKVNLDDLFAVLAQWGPCPGRER